MREREHQASAAGEHSVASLRESRADLRLLAARVGNSGFGRAHGAAVGRSAPASGVLHPSVKALSQARSVALMRTPLADAIHTAGSGSFAPVFALLAGLSAAVLKSRVRALATPDLVALRSHLAEAPAADRARISAALDEVLMWSDTEASGISTTYTGTGTYNVTDTGDTQQTHAYALWRARAVKALKSVSTAEKTAGKAWLATHEAHEAWSLHATGPEPATPGPLPSGLSTVGAPPTPSMRVVHKYEIKLPGSATTISYRDDPVNPGYQYLTNETGVGRAGKKLSDRADAAAIFTAAGISDATVRKVMTKVSTQEGGFEAVNTYDTGYISVGFIQFTSGSDGTGSLARVLREMKNSNAGEFGTFFHSMGIDVDAVALTVVDPATGNILRGADAVKAVMDDKRLTAVFQNAGTNSQAFQAAQVKRAHDEYYLAPHTFTVTAGGVTITGNYEDVLTSEAGKVAIMDRAVQHGVGNAQTTFRHAAKTAMTTHSVQSLADLASYEIEIIRALKNRIDVLSAADLTQPPAAPANPSPAPVPATP